MEDYNSICIMEYMYVRIIKYFSYCIRKFGSIRTSAHSLTLQIKLIGSDLSN